MRHNCGGKGRSGDGRKGEERKGSGDEKSEGRAEWRGQGMGGRNRRGEGRVGQSLLDRLTEILKNLRRASNPLLSERYIFDDDQYRDIKD